MSIRISTNTNIKIDCSFIQFSGGERHVQLGKMPQETPEFLKIYADLTDSNCIMDLLLLNNAIVNFYKISIPIDLEIPYLAYSRQDRVCAPGQAFSLQLMSELLKTMNILKISTWDCHSPVGLTLLNATNITQTEIIKKSQQLVKELTSENGILICPDKGAKQRCTELKDALNITTMVSCFKVREPSTGLITHTEVDAEDLTGKVAVITDDICDGGYTFIKIAEKLKEKNAKKIILYVTHGIFSKGIGVFDGLIDEIYTTNSFKQEKNEKLNVIKVNLSQF